MVLCVCTWAVEVGVVVVLSDQTQSVLVLLTALLSTEQTHIVPIQDDEGEPGYRAEAVRVDVTVSRSCVQGPVGVQSTVEP